MRVWLDDAVEAIRLPAPRRPALTTRKGDASDAYLEYVARKALEEAFGARAVVAETARRRVGAMLFWRRASMVAWPPIFVLAWVPVTDSAYRWFGPLMWTLTLGLILPGIFWTAKCLLTDRGELWWAAKKWALMHSCSYAA